MGQSTKKSKRALGRKHEQEVLPDTTDNWKAHYKSFPIPSYAWRREGEGFVLVDYNNAANALTNGKIVDYVGRSANELFADEPEILVDFFQCFTEKSSIKREIRYRLQPMGKQEHFVVWYAFVPPNLVLVYTEVTTEKVRAEQALRKAREELEVRVEKRTAELAKVNKELQKKEAELEAKSRALEENNNALKVLLAYHKNAQKEFEESVLVNVKKLLIPQIEKLKKRPLSPKEMTLVKLLDHSLNEIISPISNKLFSHYSNLTPTETQVARLVKDGMTSKEIAELMHISPKAVEFHRYHIRMKLELTNKKVNLRSYLSSLP